MNENSILQIIEIEEPQHLIMDAVTPPPTKTKPPSSCAPGRPDTPLPTTTKPPASCAPGTPHPATPGPTTTRPPSSCAPGKT